ncbi:immunoglobulin-like domain-containing protein [Psychrobacillus sp. L4]|uniref:immunoglobulin-like domain-containing protein n=1 Tax=Psychrobacillus sp. L4 TaxID=3236892 RepID=UPI0036F2F60B
MNKILILFTVISFALVGCSQQPESQTSEPTTEYGSSSNSDSNETTDWEPTIYETVNNLDEVTMIAKEGTVSSTGLTVTFENNSNKQIIYGDPSLIEKKIKGKWYQVPDVLSGNYGFNDIGYGLSSQEVKEWTTDWEWLYGNLDKGEYRIVKYILDFREAGDYDKYHLTAEFTVD